MTADGGEGHGHGHGKGKGVIMRRPDGTPMTRQEVIVQRRGAFRWLPVLCSNDLVHGSWWFTWGSFFTAIFAIYPLCSNSITGYDQHDDVLPSSDFTITWAMMIISGCFFTLGSLAFVRAFEEPPKRALFYYNKHFQSDELLGAWMFLFGTIPFVPYMFVFFIVEPNAFYFFGLVGAIVFVLGSYLFVASCYPSDKEYVNIILPLSIKFCGAHMWVVKHLANDWLAGTWFFLWANIALTFGTFLLLLVALGLGSPQQIFIWLSGFVCSFFFLIGSFYFVSGSYPHASQFYYSHDRGQADEEAPQEIYLDELGQNHDRHQMRLSIPNINIFDGPQPILKHHVPGHSENPDDNVVNPLHDGEGKRKTALLTPTTHIRQMDPKEKKKKAEAAVAAANAANAAGGQKSMTTMGTSQSSSSSSTQPAPPAYVPLAPRIVMDENRDDDDEEFDDDDRYHKSDKGPSAAALVMSGKHSSPTK